ncbi:hypothetical protein E4L96_18210 [Massilia arenosa]|uniref:DUF1640 domain-containing protein n=1 Tax=Zemynaea arenosa TaxID=2561931 RepID=A0A4Y9S5Y8_9BURK|nr:hypothetical protein [Massilia arenosa]TFW15429.1 hypothetical protein E4L96_18210 [Massilia arenosa]
MVNGEQEFDELRRAHERLEAQVNTVLPTLATRQEMKDGFDRVGERFDRLEERLDKMQERFDRKFECLYYLLLAGMGAALIAAVSMFNALAARPVASVAPAVSAPPAPAPATSALGALPAGTVLVLSVPAGPVAPPPQP